MPRSAKAKARAGGKGLSAKAAKAQRIRDTAIAPDSAPSVLEDSRAPKRRQLARRSTDEQVGRCLDTHFRGAPRSVIESKVIAGKSLRERIAGDLKSPRLHGRSRRLGTKYWRNLRELYWPVTGLDKIKYPNGDKVAPGLKRAMAKLVHTNAAQRSVEPAADLPESSSYHQQA